MGKSLHERKNLLRYIPNYVGLAPFFILLVVFILTPMIYGLAMSFTDWSVSSGRRGIHFTGLANYRYVLNGQSVTSTRFLKSLINLAIYVPITITVSVVISLSLALIINNLPGGLYRFFRSAYFIPTALPLFLCTGIWRWLMATDAGLVSVFLAKLGIGAGIDWVNTGGYAIAMIVMVDVWNTVGFNFIILSTGMQDISPELYEAADIDGASVFQKMTRITIPMLEPIIFFVITYSFISALQVYDIPTILTSHTDINNLGGPGQIALFPVMEIVRNVYGGSVSGLGRAVAEGVILMCLIMVITVIQFKVRRKRV
ncbi:carbohydrate ABC transporter permease [Breznakiella homolactica]|uniref:Sugar ABC transporter permease n=1 Tax=Breznakiella homolactica TaxID=2798577 RepID=A0A7T8B7P0_9SPIR|nr:sugar ABC transporter permease [Breznakiella homolactica]QQO07714.1 sugar ABC transporter permease [Breznakiella homolactica]